METSAVERLLQYFPRTACTFVPVSVDVTGSWAGLLVQLVYSRADPAAPGSSATFVAAHHPELGALSYEVVDGSRLLSEEEWRAGAPRREGIWWSTATAASTRPRRLLLVWHEVLPLVARVGSVADAVLLAEHLDTALHVDVASRRRTGRPEGGPGALDAEIEALERLVAQVEGVEARIGDPPRDGPGGSGPVAQEERARWRARAAIAAEDAAVVREELSAIRERAQSMLAATRAAGHRARSAAVTELRRAARSGP